MRFTIQNKIPALISFLFFADDARKLFPHWSQEWDFPDTAWTSCGSWGSSMFWSIFHNHYKGFCFRMNNLVCLELIRPYEGLLTQCAKERPFCKTQPPASIGWVALSSVIVRSIVRIGDISSHLHYLMFPSIQTIYFLWGYDPGNMSVSTYLLLLSWAQFTVV